MLKDKEKGLLHINYSTKMLSLLEIEFRSYFSTDIQEQKVKSSVESVGFAIGRSTAIYPLPTHHSYLSLSQYETDTLLLHKVLI